MYGEKRMRGFSRHQECTLLGRPVPTIVGRCRPTGAFGSARGGSISLTDSESDPDVNSQEYNSGLFISKGIFVGELCKQGKMA